MSNGDAGNSERWRELCQKAAAEQDSAELMKLVDEINQSLEKKFERSERSTPD
jgi:hypothetical protein